MHNKCKLLLLLVLATIPVSILFSQTRTFSPFSRYGLGEIYNKGFGRNTGMGGTGIGLRSPHGLNNLNPASYTAFDTLSFYFESGLSAFSQDLKTSGGSVNFSDINFDYFAFGFPVGKRVFASLGILPASNAGYKYFNLETIGSDVSFTNIIGSGNITNFYAGIGIKINTEWSVGMHAKYWFGNINHTSFSDLINDPAALKYGKKTKIHISDVFVDFGLQYTNVIGKNNRYILGATFSPKMGVNGDMSRRVASGNIYHPDGDLFLQDSTISFNETKLSASNFELPLGLGVGASFTFNNKLTVAADYSKRMWSDANYFDDITQTTNATFYNFGAEWVPNERSGTKYFQRIRYRGGFYYTQDYIKINGYQIEDIGMSFGLGLPLKRSNTSVNIAYEYGIKGTAEATQMKEKHHRISLNFTMHEYWFFKRKFE